MGGVFYVQVNGSELWKVKTGTTTYRNVKYYMSDPWYASALDVATFGTIQVATGGDNNGIRPGQQLIQKNNLVQTLDTWGPDFNIKFDMRIVKLPTGWHNILHYTTVGNQNRIPGLWLNSKKGRPYIHIVMGKHNKDITLEMNKDYSINLVARKGVFYVHVNVSGLWKVKTGTTVYRNVKYYMSDPWYASAVDVATFGTIQVATPGDLNLEGTHIAIDKH